MTDMTYNQYRIQLEEYRPVAIMRLQSEGVEGIYESLQELGFFKMPASTKYHGSYKGGLFDHSLAVAYELEQLTEKLGLKWSEPRSPFLVGILHDLCKTDSYVYDDFEAKWSYRDDILIPGHGEKSVIMAQKLLDLTEEEMLCIRWHMGAFETDKKMWDYYGKAVTAFPNVLYTHTADMIASRIRGI